MSSYGLEGYDYTWIFWHRIRHRGQAKFNANIPSNFHAHETLVLLSELELAGQCAKGVHASSGLVQMFLNSMIRNQNGLTYIQMIDIDIPRPIGRVSDASQFIKALEAKLKAAKAAVKKP